MSYNLWSPGPSPWPRRRKMKPETVATWKWLGWLLLIVVLVYYVLTTFVGVGSVTNPHRTRDMTIYMLIISGNFS